MVIFCRWMTAGNQSDGSPMQAAPPLTHQPIPWRQYGMVALGLMGITFAAFAIIYPLNGAPFDDWQFPFYGQQRTLTIYLSFRQFGLIPAILVETFSPGNVAAHLFVQQVMVCAIGFSLFHLTRRFLPGREVFALLVGIAFILYIPTNRDISRTLYSASIYTWVTLMMALSAVLLVEAMRMRSRWGWGWLLASSVFGYMSIRAYESTIPVILSLPFLLVFIRSLWKWDTALRVILWWILPFTATALSLYTLLAPGASDYQGALLPEGGSVSPLQQLPAELNLFLGQSFPLETAFTPAVNYALPALLLTGLVVVLVLLYWRLQPQPHPLLTIQQALIVLVVGWLFTVFGGLVWSYLGISQYGMVYRAHFHAAPGQAVTAAAALALVAALLYRLVRLPHVASVVLLLVVTVPAAGHWFLESQQEADEVHEDWRTFDENLELYRDVTAAAPRLADDTLLVMVGCQQEADYPPHQWTVVSIMGMIYTYGWGVRAEQPDRLEFTPEGIVWNNIFYEETITYPYDQVVAFTCQDERVYLLDHFPQDLQPAGFDPNLYNPYARLQQQFLPEQQARLFSW